MPTFSTTFFSSHLFQFCCKLSVTQKDIKQKLHDFAFERIITIIIFRGQLYNYPPVSALPSIIINQLQFWLVLTEAKLCQLDSIWVAQN